MMKKIFGIGIALVLLCVAVVPSQAGITGSRHDVTDATATTKYAQFVGFASYGNCSACHIPHGAAGQKLFPNTPQGTAGGFYGPLCMTCHSSSIINNVDITADSTVMGSASHGLDILQLQARGDHEDVANSGLPYADGSGPTSTDEIECTTCHDVHNSAATPERPFLWLDIDTLCQQCHTNRVNNATTTVGRSNNAGGSGATHPAGTTFVGDVTGMATAPNSPIDFSTGGRLVTNAVTTGSLWTQTVWNSGVQLTGQTATGGVTCVSCHNVHWDENDATPANGTAYVAAIDDGMPGEANLFCEYCHRGSTTGSAGTYWWNPGNATRTSHPNDDVGAGNTNMNLALTWMAALGTSSSTTGTGDSGLICTSCHGVHPGDSTAPETELNTPILLQHSQPTPMDICGECHSGGTGFLHHPTGTGLYATLGNGGAANEVTCGGGNLEGYTTCHGAGGLGSIAHNRTTALGAPPTGTWDTATDGGSYMCVVCHSWNPSSYTTSTPYTAGGTASHFVGDTGAVTWNNGRTTTTGGNTAPIQTPGSWTGSGLTSIFQDGAGTGTVIICESCHRLADGNIQDGDGDTAMLLTPSGSDVATVSNVYPHTPSAADYTGAPYLCTGCHWAPSGTHPLAQANEGAYAISGGAGQSYAGTAGLNCESCHSPHDAQTETGSYILDGGNTGGATSGMEVEPTINYTAFCAVCHGTFQ